MSGRSDWRKWLKRVLAEAPRQGFRIDRVGDGWKLTPPDPTKPKVLLHATPSDRRAIDNARARLRRAGFDVGVL